MASFFIMLIFSYVFKKTIKFMMTFLECNLNTYNFNEKRTFFLFILYFSVILWQILKKYDDMSVTETINLKCVS